MDPPSDSDEAVQKCADAFPKKPIRPACLYCTDCNMQASTPYNWIEYPWTLSTRAQRNRWRAGCDEEGLPKGVRAINVNDSPDKRFCTVNMYTEIAEHIWNNWEAYGQDLQYRQFIAGVFACPLALIFKVLHPELKSGLEVECSGCGKKLNTANREDARPYVGNAYGPPIGLQKNTVSWEIASSKESTEKKSDPK